MSKNPKKSDEDNQNTSYKESGVKIINKILIFSASEEWILDQYDIRCRRKEGSKPNSIRTMYESPLFHFENKEQVMKLLGEDLKKQGLVGLINTKRNIIYHPKKGFLISYYGTPVEQFYIIEHRQPLQQEPED